MSQGFDDGKLAELRDLLSPRPFSSISEYLRLLRKESPDETILWRRCAFPLSIDRELFEKVLKKGLVEDILSFDQLISSTGIETVPRLEGVYRMRNAARVERLDEWLRAEPKLDSLRTLASSMLAHFGKNAPEFERLRCLAVTRDQNVLPEFRTLFEDADRRFDMSRCQVLVDLLRDLDAIEAGDQSTPLKLLTPELRAFCDEKLQYIQRRQLFAEEYYRTISYHQRELLFKSFEAFLSNQDRKWIFDIYATGGMGKTMFLRWLVAHYCVPHALPVARIDFDYIRVPILRDAPWLILLPIAEQLNIQISGQPFEEYISELREFGPLLQLPVILPPGTDLSGLQATIASQSDSWSKQWADRFVSKFSGIILVLLDTLEEAILHHPDALDRILKTLRQIHRRMPQLRMVLSGRYWMGDRKRVPYFNEVLAKETESVEVLPFTEEEASSYLTMRRSLSPEAYPIPNLIRKAGGIPMRLCLLADIALQYDSLAPQEVDKFEPEFEYLIRRIINRIPERDGDVRWVIRYGAIARRLTRNFVEEVLYPHLERERKRDSNENLDRVQRYRDSWKGYELRGIDQLWSRLGDYASHYGWLRPTATELRFEPEVIHPIRKLVSQEQIFQTIHRSAAAWFEKRAAGDPATWGDSVADAIYHRFEADGAEAAPFWRDCIKIAKSKGNTSVVRSLIGVPIGPEFVDDEGTPFAHFNGWTPVDDAILAEAYFHDAELTCWQQVEFPNFTENWAQVRERLRRARLHQRRAPQPLFSDESVAMVECCINLGEQKYSAVAARALTEMAKAKNPKIRFILAMQAGIASESEGNRSQALRNYQEARRIAEKHDVMFPRYVVAHRIGRLYASLHKFYAAERELLDAMKAGETAKTGDVGLETKLELAKLYVSAWRFQQALHMLSSLPPNLESGNLQYFQAQCLRITCHIHRWYLLEAAEIIERLSQESSPPVFRAQCLELKGILDSALFNNSAVESLEEAAGSYATLGEHEASARANLLRIRHAIECEGDYRGAGRLLDKADQRSPETSTIQRLIYRLQLAHLQGDAMAKQKIWNAALDKLDQANLLDRAAAWAAALAFSVARDETAAAMKLREYLEAIEPDELRVQVLGPFRYRKDPLDIPRSAGKSLTGSVSIGTGPVADFPSQVIAAIDFIRVVDLSQAKKLFEKLMSVQEDDSSLLLHREMWAAGGRLDMPPPSQEMVAEFTSKIKTHGLAAVTRLEDDVRHTAALARENLRHLSADIDPSALRSIRGTQWEALRYTLAESLDKSPERNNIYKARRIYDKLGMHSPRRMIELEEEEKPSRATKAYKETGPDRQKSENRVMQDTDMGDSGPAYAEDVLIIVPKAPQWTNTLTLASNLMTELASERGAAGATDVGEIGYRLANLLTIPALAPDARVGLRLEDSLAGHIPWELAFPRNRICFRLPAKQIPSERGLTGSESTSFPSTLILEPSTEFQERNQRGFHRSRVNLNHLYDLYRGGGKAIALHDPTPASVIDAVASIHPQIIHVRSGFRFSPSIGVQFEFIPTHTARESSFDRSIFTPEAFGKALSVHSGLAPLIILDPPMPPDLHEAALQLFYRNAFATELIDINPCAILAIGLASPETVDEHSSRLVQRFRQGGSLAELLQLFRQHLAGNLFSTHAAALFAHDPDFEIA